MRRIGVLMAFDENDSQTRGWLANFTQGLAELGWTDGRTVRLEVRWAAGNVDRMRTFAKELVELQPDVILASTTPVTAALQRDTSTIPIVFVLVSDPVGAGFVAGLPRPGRNITGFTNIEGAAFGGKWLGMLKEIAPRVRRVAIMFNPDTAPGGGAFFLNPFEVAARSLSVEPITMRVRSDAEIEAGITSLRREQEPHAGSSGNDHFANSSQQCAGHWVRLSSIRQGGRLTLIWSELLGNFSPSCSLCRSHFTRS